MTYVFVPVRTTTHPPPPSPPATDFSSCDNFRTTFRISFIFGRIDGPDICISWLDFGRLSWWPWPWIFKVKYGIFAISQPKWSDCRETKGKHIDWSLHPKMWPSALTLAMTVALNFKVKYGICYISAKNGPIATKWKANISIANRYRTTLVTFAA